MTETARKEKELELKAEENEINRAKADETARSNRATEGIRKVGNILGAVTGGLSGSGSILRGIGAIRKISGGPTSFSSKRKGFYNAPEWYKKYPEFAQYVSKCGEPKLVGEEIIVADGTYPISSSTTLPAILALYYISTIGPETGLDHANFPINKELDLFHETVMSTNSRTTTTWDGGDAGQVAFAASSLVEETLNLALTLRCCETEENFVQLESDCLIRARGFDPTTFRNEKNDIKAKLYDLVAKINQIPIPASLSIFQRRMFTSTLLVKDGDTLCHQIYSLAPRFFYVYDEVNAAVVPDFRYDKYAGIGGSTQSISQYVDVLIDAANKLFTSPSLKQMYTDVRGAYDKKDLLHIDSEQLLSNKGPIDIPVSHEVATQIMNASLLPDMNCKDTFNKDAHTVMADGVTPNITLSIRQDTDGRLVMDKAATVNPSSNVSGPVLYFNHQLANSYYESACGFDGVRAGTSTQSQVFRKILNFYKNNLTDDDMLVSTRLTALWNIYTVSTIPSGQSYSYDEFSSIIHGTELITGARIITGSENGVLISDEVGDGGAITSVTAGAQILRLVSTLSRFDWCPTYRLRYVGNALSFKQYCNPLVLTTNELYKLHRVCTISEFKFINTTEFKLFRSSIEGNHSKQ